MKKIILIIILLMNFIFHCIPFYMSTPQLCAEQTIVQYDDNIGHCHPTEPPGPIVTTKELLGGFFILFVIFFVIFVIFLPVIIYEIIYHYAEKDSTLKKVMNIANIIFAILTLGLFGFGKYNDKNK